MRFRKIITVLVIITIVLSLCSCSKITEKVAEKGMEKIFENATGAEVDITKDGLSIEVDGGNVQTGENLKWPKDAMGDIPDPKANIIFIMINEDSKGGSLTVKDFDEKKAKKYVEKLEDLGYNPDTNMKDSDSIVFLGSKEDGSKINFTYSIESEEGTIIYSVEK